MATKSKKGTLILLGCLVILIVGATLLYNQLSKNADDYLGNDIESSDPVDPVEELEAIDFMMTNAQGEQVSLSDFYGKPIIINFWATWCPYCVKSMPTYQSMYDKYGDDVEFIMLNATDGKQETEKIAAEYIEKEGYTFPVFYDYMVDEGETVHQLGSYVYGATTLPSALFIDSDSMISSARKGAISEKDLEDEIKSLLE